MADTIKILGQAANPTTDTTLLTGTTNGTTISSIMVCNTTTGSLTFRMWCNPSGGANTVSTQAIFYDLLVSPNDTFTATVGITLATGDTIHCFGSATGLIFSAFGVNT